ncbi:alanine dehydrogenase [Paenibacillus sp.]|uniref:alanine dehydrogenase n=1 Tax=Paenibacillus sp. TaxID=58172 RepID=UPI002D7096B1|nr:alanine dehydrogenase [Paenibacillus sp.]HZG55016.1 alanine dehydrogenase [Paenibacillus sp.]
MIIGVPKELKSNESRVALTPTGAHTLVEAGHQVIVETGAGAGSGFADDDYASAGAILEEKASDVWSRSEMVLKVKEPLPSEYGYFREGLLLFTYLHLAADPELTTALLGKGVTAVAYETVEVGRSLPLLTPMSEIAGRMAAQIGAQYLERVKGGKGILLGGVPGVQRGRVTIVGGGVVGTNAARIAAGLGADVTILDQNAERLRQLDDLFGTRVQTLVSNPSTIAESVAQADLVIGAVLVPGAKAPKLVTERMIRTMSPGSVVIDVAIDQGGIFETVDRITTHERPTYEKHGVVHYAVANMPGAVPRTSTLALTNATLPYALQLANKGIRRAIAENVALRQGVNVAAGQITHAAVANALGYGTLPVEEAFDVKITA